MRDETRLGSASAVPEPEDENREAGVARKPCDAVVDDRHGEERTGALLRLHPAGRHEADHWQPLFRASNE